MDISLDGRASACEGGSVARGSRRCPRMAGSESQAAEEGREQYEAHGHTLLPPARLFCKTIGLLRSKLYAVCLAYRPASAMGVGRRGMRQFVAAPAWPVVPRADRRRTSW